MLVISDTNILSSLAAGEALDVLWQMFPQNEIWIPPTVLQELQIGFSRGKPYLNSVLTAITNHKIKVQELSAKQRETLPLFPEKLNLGEREAIILAQSFQALLLSNDKAAIRYCQQQSLEVIDLPRLLRFLWVSRLISQPQVKQLIQQMEQVERLKLNYYDQAKIFAPRGKR